MNLEFQYIPSDPIEESYKKHMNLKEDKNYREQSIKTAYSIIGLFEKTYPGVVIEPPILREKSPRSIKDKIKNLEIERTSKLALLEAEIPNQLHSYEIKRFGKVQFVDYYHLFTLLSERVDETIDSNKRDFFKSNIHNVLYKDINQIDIPYVEALLLGSDKLSKTTKSSICRVLYARIESSNLSNKKELLNDIDKNFGKKAAEISGVTNSDILSHSSIDSLINVQYDTASPIYDNRYSSKLERLLDEQEFLRCKDLQGMQIIIKEIPKSFSTDNYQIQTLLTARNKLKDTNSNEYKKLDQECMNAISKDFIQRFKGSNINWLSSNNAKLIRDSDKFKNKPNGYVACHTKFELSNDPNKSFELQVKSIYVDELSHGSGSASHSARSGKNRIIPALATNQKISNIKDVNPSALKKFSKDLDYFLPKFICFEKEDGKYTHYIFTKQENCFKFFEEHFNKNHNTALRLAFLLNLISRNDNDDKGIGEK